MKLRPTTCLRVQLGVLIAALAWPCAAPGAYIISGAATPRGSAVSSSAGKNSNNGQNNRGDPVGNGQYSRRRYPGDGHRHDDSHRSWRRAWRERGDQEHRNAERSREFGSQTSGSCGRQGTCLSRTGSGYRSMASGLNTSSSSLRNQVAALAQAQRQLASYSYNQSPGPSNADAKGFYDATNGGRSRRAGYQASDPEVKSQVEQYDELGQSMDDLDDDANKYDEQAAEMNRMADTSEQRAENIDTQNAPVNSAGPNTASVQNILPASIGPMKDVAKLQKNPPAKAAAPQDLDKGAAFAGSAPGSLSDLTTSKANAYPTRNAATLANNPSGGGGALAAGGGSAGPQRSLRDALREKFYDKFGREPSSTELEGFAREEGRAPASAQAAASLAADKAGSTTSTDESVASFERGLGNPRLSISGSETEASVKAMLSELGAEEGRGRALASLQAAGIGLEDGPTLFERAHATHQRCERNGCVRAGRGGQ